MTRTKIVFSILLTTIFLATQVVAVGAAIPEPDWQRDQIPGTRPTSYTHFCCAPKWGLGLFGSG